MKDSVNTPPVLELSGVSKTYRVKQGMFGKVKPLTAVNDVSLQLGKGEVLGLVGESGCGKSTLAKILLGLEQPTAGHVKIDGEEITQQGRLALARRIQPIFQDPYSSLNPRKSIYDVISLPLRVHGIGDEASRKPKVKAKATAARRPKDAMDALANAFMRDAVMTEETREKEKKSKRAPAKTKRGSNNIRNRSDTAKRLATSQSYDTYPPLNSAVCEIKANRVTLKAPVFKFGMEQQEESMALSSSSSKNSIIIDFMHFCPECNALRSKFRFTCWSSTAFALSY